jgi:hypothetical protein
MHVRGGIRPVFFVETGVEERHDLIGRHLHRGPSAEKGSYVCLRMDKINDNG